MRREDLLEMFKRVPEIWHAQMNLVLHNQAVLSVDQIARCEPTYLVFRGREGGTTDEGRAFFVPYDDISYIRLERVVRVNDLKRMYGEETGVDAEDRLSSGENAPPVIETPAPALDTKTPAPVTAPSPAMDPASIAKQNLLDRIRATRASVAGTTGKLDKK